MTQNAASDQELHNLPLVQQFLDTTASGKMDLFQIIALCMLGENISRHFELFFSSPVRSTRRAIVVTPVVHVCVCVPVPVTLC